MQLVNPDLWKRCNAIFLWVWLGMKGTKEDHNVTDVSCVSHNLAVNREEIDGDIVLFATTTRWLHIITTNKENDLQSARAAEPWNSPKLFLIGSFLLQYWNLQSLQSYRAEPCMLPQNCRRRGFSSYCQLIPKMLQKIWRITGCTQRVPRYTKLTVKTKAFRICMVCYWQHLTVWPGKAILCNNKITPQNRLFWWTEIWVAWLWKDLDAKRLTPG